MRKPVLIIVALIAASPCKGQESGMAFLRIGANAAASAMGDAQVAASRDAFATFWNPAGLAASRDRTAAISHRVWIGNLRMYDLTAGLPLGTRSSVGILVTASDSGDLEARDMPGEPFGTFRAQFISAGLSYARSLGALRAGVTAKFLKERFFEADASGYAFDAGLQASLAAETVLLGAAIRNVGKMSRLEREATRLPRMLHAGAAFYPLHILSIADGTSLLDVMVSAEVSHLVPSSLTRLHLGVAATVMEMVILRVGYISRDAPRTVTSGVGIDFDELTFDYAYIPFDSGFEGPGHVLTLAYRW